jgi:nucleotide-binding universal stress UspA family protein
VNLYRRILVPLDGSELSERALPFAETLARRSGALLILVRAVEAHVPPGGDVPGAQRTAVTSAEAYLNHVAEGLAPEQAVETGVYYGPAPGGIVEEVCLRGADLVVMSTHGRSGLSRLILGSVADYVLRHSPVPVMLVPQGCDRAWEQPTAAAAVEAVAAGAGQGQPNGAVQAAQVTQAVAVQEDRRGGHPFRLLVPLDGSGHATLALPAAREIAWAMRQATVDATLLGAIDLTPELFYAAGTLTGPSELPDVETDSRSMRAYLEREAAVLRDVCRSVTCCVRLGPAEHAIVERVAHEGVDLVVMATHGRGGLGRMLLGSVAAALLHQLRCPLLLVRPAVMRETYHEPAAPEAAESRTLVTA